MKILHLIYDDIHNNWLGGGGARRVVEIYKRFPDYVKVTVITGNYKGAKHNYKIGNIKFKRVGLNWSYLISRFTYSLFVPLYLLFGKYDIIVDDYSAHSPTFSFLFAKKPVIGSFQNFHSLVNYQHFGKVVGFITKILDNLFVRKFKYIISVSPYLKNYFIEKKRKWRQKNFVVKYIGVGIDDRLFRIKSFPPNKKKRYILYLGRIDIFQKGLDILLQAFKLVLIKEKNLKLVIAGTGKDLHRLRKLVREVGVSKNIKILGWVSDKKKFELLQNAVLVCMPSRFEAFPVLPIEAMALGTPIIATKIEGIKEIITNNKTGILIPKENHIELARKILFILNNKELQKRLNINAQKEARKYNWFSVSRKFFNFYKNILKLHYYII